MEIGLTETTTFVDELFGDETGVVYAPTMEKKWTQYFFSWPSQRDNLLKHLADNGKRDVYLSPVLFTQPLVNPNTFKGTRFVWTEFDGTVPENSAIQPTIRIKSSTDGREHWYWRLSEFTTDADTVIDVTKRIAYALDADLSAWDYAQVLRPPGTLNHKRKLPVILLSNSGVSYQLDTFREAFPNPPESIEVQLDKSSLDTLQRIVAKYQWSDDAYDLLTKALTRGKRSDQMALLAFYCVEMGMSTNEAYVVLEDVDRRCKKFTGRTDRDRRILALISYVRGKLAANLEKIDRSPIYRFNDFMETEVTLKWVIPGILPVAGSAMIFGPPGYGKSTWAIRMGMSIASGAENFLEWPIEKQQKVLFLSLEMPHDELKHFMSDMQIDHSIIMKLQENFFVWPVGHPYPLDVPDQQIELLKFIDQFGIELVIIDSLGFAMYGKLRDDDDVKRLLSFLNEDLRVKRGCGYFFVHHPRKPGVADRAQPSDMYDSFGSTYIINNAQTVINFNPGGSPLTRRVNIYKSRLALEKTDFSVRVLPNRDFERVASSKKKAELETEAARGNIFNWKGKE